MLRQGSDADFELLGLSTDRVLYSCVVNRAVGRRRQRIPNFLLRHADPGSCSKSTRRLRRHRYVCMAVRGQPKTVAQSGPVLPFPQRLSALQLRLAEKLGPNTAPFSFSVRSAALLANNPLTPARLGMLDSAGPAVVGDAAEQRRVAVGG